VELENLRRKASQAELLEDENVALIAEINALRDFYHDDTYKPDRTKRVDASPTPRTPLAPQSTNQLNSSKHSATRDNESLTFSKLKADFSRVEDKYTKLYNKYLEVQDLLRESNGLVRDRNHTIKNWKEHVKELNEQLLKRAHRIKKLEAKCAEVNQDPSSSSFSSDSSDAAIETEPDMMTIVPLSHDQSRAPERNRATGPEARLRIPDFARNVNDRRSSLIASKSTLVSTLPSDLETSEPTTTMTTTATSPRLPPLPQNREVSVREVRIKSEPSSDTPVVVSECRVRKRKLVEDDEAGLRVARIKRERIETLSNDEHRHFSSQESIDFDLENRSVRTPKKHTRYSHEQGIRPLGSNNAGRSRADAGDPTPQPATNNQVLQRRSVSGQNSRKQVVAGIPRGFAGLAEDEDEDEDENTTHSVSKTQPRANVLAQLLNTPSPAQNKSANQNSAHRNTSLSAKDGQKIGTFKLPKKRELPFGKAKGQKVDTAQYSRPNRASNMDIHPNQDERAAMSAGEEKAKPEGRLRHLPKDKLHLTDFKINPHANGGYNYAFSDVIRNKDERACLQGCIKENCCGGKFRALARTFRPSTRPLEFQSLLESYLGDQCHQLSTMSEAGKEALWLEAKTRELADAHGRHRHRYRPMSSPPGFWRLDFPDTQEREQDNREAMEMERDAIEERYREAIRPGGLWMFRDE
jgi:hypothetical protein